MGPNELEIFGRGERIRTSGLYVPNVALYQAKLHPDRWAIRYHMPKQKRNSSKAGLKLEDPRPLKAYDCKGSLLNPL